MSKPASPTKPRPSPQGSFDWQMLLNYVDLSQTDLDVLAQHADFFDAHAAPIVDAFYTHLYSFPHLRTIIETHSSLAQIKQKTIQYLKTLGSPSIDSLSLIHI